MFGSLKYCQHGHSFLATKSQLVNIRPSHRDSTLTNQVVRLVQVSEVVCF